MRRHLGLPPYPETQHRQARGTFRLHAQAILEEWMDLEKQSVARRADSPNAFFKREAYALLKHYVEHNLSNVFCEITKIDSRANRLVHEASKNPFKLGLLAMFTDESPLSRNNRHVFGNQMLYSWYHDVPPEFINAFLAVSGGPAQIAEKLKQPYIEPGFSARYAPERFAVVNAWGAIPATRSLGSGTLDVSVAT